MKIALGQTNPLVGDFRGNSAKVLTALRQAREAGCALAVFPELALCGYPPQDLLERPAFVAAHDEALTALTAEVHGIGLILGVIERRQGRGKPLYNSALLIEDGIRRHTARKRLLPSYDVFDERRYFEPGGPGLLVDFHGLRLALTVCEDIWSEGVPDYGCDPVAELLAQGDRPDCLINVSASPFHAGKQQIRRQVFGELCRRHRLPLLYVNQVGGQDSLLFDGRSMVLGADGLPRACAAAFREDLLLLDSSCWQQPPAAPPLEEAPETEVFQALVMGVRDYLRKCGFSSAVLGLSGGIDSALTAVIACRALGPENVTALLLPSPYTSQASLDDARALAARLGCRCDAIPITSIFDSFRRELKPFAIGGERSVTEQNLQARVRGSLLMAWSNQHGQLLLTTGNKSELAVGYCTLYGDMNGGLAVIADVPKQMVYQLARWLNRQEELIPARIIERPPTAELAPGQCDQDDLPPYPVLDDILGAYLEERLPLSAIVARGHDPVLVRDVLRRIRLNEYKRKQAPPGLRVTTKAFGPGRRYPTVQHFVE